MKAFLSAALLLLASCRPDQPATTTAAPQAASAASATVVAAADTLAVADAAKTVDKMCAALHIKRGAVLEVSNSSSPERSSINGYRPAASIELYSKNFGGQGFKMSPELLRFDSQCSLSSALE